MGMIRAALEDPNRLLAYRIKTLSIWDTTQWTSDHGRVFTITRKSREIYQVEADSAAKTIRQKPGRSNVMSWILAHLTPPAFVIVLPRPPLREGMPEQLCLPGFVFEKEVA